MARACVFGAEGAGGKAEGAGRERSGGRGAARAYVLVQRIGHWDDGSARKHMPQVWPPEQDERGGPEGTGEGGGSGGAGGEGGAGGGAGAAWCAMRM